MAYKDLLEEAKAEFAKWDEVPKACIVRSAGKVFKKESVVRPPCKCGAKYFCKDKCKTCYFKDYNAKRPGRKSGRASKARQRAQKKEWRKNNPEKVREYQRRYHTKKKLQADAQTLSKPQEPITNLALAAPFRLCVAG